MKKILFILVLLTQFNFAQNEPLILFDGGYDTDAKLYFTAATSLSSAQKTRIDTFIKMVKSQLAITSLSSKFDVMYLLANEDSVSSKLNLVKRLHDAVQIGTSTFTQWEGWQGNGINGYLRPSYIPSSASVVYAQTNASLAIYSRTNQSKTEIDVEAKDGSNRRSGIELYSNVFYLLLNSTGATTSPALAGTAGFFVGSRTTVDDSLRSYRNGVKIKTATIATTTTLPEVVFFIGGQNNNGTLASPSSKQYSFFSIGVGLTDAEIVKLNTCIEWYMDDLGKGVQ